MTEKDLLALHDEYTLNTYSPHLMLVRGAMSNVWDIAGREYLDFTTGISVCNLGHCHPRVTEAIQRQAARLVHVSNLFYNENQPRLAAVISKATFGGKVFFCNSGAEANEGLIKLARRWGAERGRFEIVCMEGSFHGRTLATLAATGRAKYRKGFQPDMPGFVHVPFNDLEAVCDAIGPQTAAVLLEPVQGEGGIVPATGGFIEGVRKLCSTEGVLLLFDEVQCGMGRTGHLFAYQAYGVTPDAMAMAKALANGMAMGAFEVRNEFAGALPPGTHASTFGGNPLACAAALAVFETFEQDAVLENVRHMATRLWQGLEVLRTRHPEIREVRGKGLMIGVDVGRPVADMITAARAKGLLILPAGETVLRLLPPLTVQPEEIDLALGILDQVLADG
ncbi:MAG: aspartate aminotransferase family protein [Kiritimatiellaeota bacterium]|nr:aspartate aminotransferase family protein [Kiritimatiellota bacterium]